MTVLAGHRRRDLAILLHRPSSEQNTYPMTPNGMTVEINGERRRLIALSAKETHRRRTCPKSDRASDRRGCARRRRCGRYGEGMKEKSKERRSRREATMKAGEKKEDSVTVERWARKKDEFDERGWLWRWEPSAGVHILSDFQFTGCAAWQPEDKQKTFKARKY